MSNNVNIKKLDEVSLLKLKEGSGPADECLCSILSPPEGRKGFAATVKKAFGALSKGKGGNWPGRRGNRSVEIPLGYSKTQSGIKTTREVVKRQESCGRCGCDMEKLVLKHSVASIRITTPDISSICPCPSNCLPDKERLQNNIKVVVENAKVESSPNFGRI